MVKTDLQPIDDSVIWSTLLELNCLDLIYEWIDFSFSTTNKSEETLTTNEKEDGEAKSSQTINHHLFNDKLTQAMLDLIPTCRTLPTDCKIHIFNYLAKYFFTSLFENP